jgi:hypothetical protein
MAGSQQQFSDGVAAALGIHLCLYCALGGCFAFGFYALMQPTLYPNPGVAAYEPPPATVINYTLAPRLRNNIQEPLASPALQEPEPETTGRSTARPELVPAPAPAPVAKSSPKVTRKPPREVKAEHPTLNRSACIPGYDSSGAQTRPC